uniref:ATP-dependent Clp protease proteolytic subunit n=1 Tax=Chromera velia CCMP2878 TaxID=1169474 RepID=A0A0G4HG18_9ALVE|eukprot:Cvel_6726.t1-p1 / transcript=Cvel_6726.t1 / gene=Cvel_6726 / organism=Chromera_velia_CCMP2878 / gene_product=ATP-dependent Clp protease proteolytic, putative / transcript_product=ATP-dependent Clp protease proteolytic, putative / location=Cvel_scaffold336:37883-40008(+) / protein_length=398 / sequence_SO=supercontig / SO=protein_coding / is_pseudo=false
MLRLLAIASSLTAVKGFLPSPPHPDPFFLLERRRSHLSELQAGIEREDNLEGLLSTPPFPVSPLELGDGDAPHVKETGGRGEFSLSNSVVELPHLPRRVTERRRAARRMREARMQNPDDNAGAAIDYEQMMREYAEADAREKKQSGALPQVGPPPDLSSMLFHNRIIYLGMPIVPAVTELMVQCLLYLNYESETRPVFLYINSPGSELPDSTSGFETEAFAIADVMKYVKPPIHTIAVGQCWGSANLLCAYGAKGKRFALPNANFLFKHPINRASGVVTDVVNKAKEAIGHRLTMEKMIAGSCRQPLTKVQKDFSRTKYLSPEEAIQYGLIDKVLESEKELSSVPEFIQQMRRKSGGTALTAGGRGGLGRVDPAGRGVYSGSTDSFDAFRLGGDGGRR